MTHPFTDEELLTIFEAARTGLADGERFDQIAEDMDLSDEHLIALRDKLQAFMDEPPPTKPAWIDSHSVNCYHCEALVDERECVPNTKEHGGNDDGGSICPQCQKSRKA